MSIDIIDKLNLEQLRKGFLKYTRMAFQMLPKMNSPRILDIGCGTGVPTLELARLSDGEHLDNLDLGELHNIALFILSREEELFTKLSKIKV